MRRGRGVLRSRAGLRPGAVRRKPAGGGFHRAPGVRGARRRGRGRRRRRYLTRPGPRRGATSGCSCAPTPPAAPSTGRPVRSPPSAARSWRRPYCSGDCGRRPVQWCGPSAPSPRTGCGAPRWRSAMPPSGERWKNGDTWNPVEYRSGAGGIGPLCPGTAWGRACGRRFEGNQRPRACARNHVGKDGADAPGS